MSTAKISNDDADAARRKIFIIAAIVSAVLIAALVFWATRSRSGNVNQQPRLAGALRADSAEFAGMRDRIVVDFNPDEDATESTRPAGDIVMNMRPRIRNFTGRIINGLELQATVVDLAENPVRQRFKIAIPNAETGQTELETNKVMTVPIMLEGLSKDSERANIRIVVTGVKFK